MLDDFDFDIPEDDGDEEYAVAEETGNRTFLLVAGGLGALAVISLLVFAAIAFFVVIPQRQQEADAIATQNANIAELEKAQTQTAIVEAYTPTFTATFTQAPTATSTATQEPSPTEEVIEATADDTATFTPEGPTADPRTATVQALYTQAALAQTQAVQFAQTETATVTALPDTGIFDDLNDGPLSTVGMVGLAFALVIIILLSRQLRSSEM